VNKAKREVNKECVQTFINMPNSKRNRKALLIFIIFFFLAIACSAFKIYQTFNKNDPYLTEQWYLNNIGNISLDQQDKNILYSQDFKKGIDINASEMWKKLNLQKHINPEVIVAVIDSGIDINHDDLKGAIWKNKDEIAGDGIDNDNNGYVDDIYGYNFCNGNGNVNLYRVSSLENYHGTAVAGIIAAKYNNKIGISGVAGDAKVKIMSLKILNSGSDFNTGKINNLISAINYAEKNGAEICNLSMSLNYSNSNLRNTIKRSSMLFVVSAGNGDILGRNIDSEKIYPASYDFKNVITVANLNHNGRLNRTSNYGKKVVDLAAPGTDVFTTVNNNSYAYVTGTSFAAPVVTGVAALLYATKKDVNPVCIKNAICCSVSKSKNLSDKVRTGGYLNGYKAICSISK